MKTRGFPGMFAPTYQELHELRSVAAATSFTCETQRFSASTLGSTTGNRAGDALASRAASARVGRSVEREATTRRSTGRTSRWWTSAPPIEEITARGLRTRDAEYLRRQYIRSSTG